MGKKLLFVASSGVHIRNFHLPYLAALKEAGWDIHVACAGSEGLEAHGARVTELPFEKKLLSTQNLKAARILRRIIKEDNIQALILHTSLAACFGRLALLGLPKRPRVVNVVHGYLFDDDSPLIKRFAYLGVERLLAPVTDLVMTMNRWDEICAKKHRLAKAVESIDGMGVNFSWLDGQKSGDPETLRRELGLVPTDFVLLYPGEFSRRKSQIFLLKTLELLPDEVKLVLPGQGVLLEECRRYAEKRGIAHRIRFPGAVTQVGRYYEMADVLVSASRSEGLPFAVMEAMYFGLPVVVSRVKGHEDLIRNEENGLLYPYGDPETCAACIRSVMEDRDRAAAMKRQASIDAQRYSLERVFPQVMKRYMDILE